ncbi:importin-4 isoform X2 [Lepisosteus oculatus]|uniref:importin-4 isoform X2 n=1 Tax=Lepisosteus oculatus TaxID=7918 RepID=UPI00372313F4
MTEELEHILSQLTEPDNAVIRQATAQLKQAFKDPAVIPALCAVMTGSQNPQVRQSASVMLRMRVSKHWKKIDPEHRESLKSVVLQAFQQETEHKVRHSLSQLAAVLVKHETPDRWPALLALLNQSTKSNNPQDRQVGLLLLSKVVESNPEPFKPHYRQLLQLFHSTLQDLANPTALYYSIQTLTAMSAYTGTQELNLMRSIVPKLIVAIQELIKTDQSQASEAMEVFDELMESEVSIIVPHISDIVHFCLEVSADSTLSDSVRVKALSCIAFLIRLKSKTVLKQKLLAPILQTVFPVLSAAPPPGQEDPEDEEHDNEELGEESETPKHYAAQVIDTLALHLPPEKLFGQLTPLTQAALVSENPYQRKAGLMCLAVLAEGCADHIRTKLLSSLLQVVCRALEDESQVVRSAALFALGQFSEHLQPDISKFSEELMPLLLGYLSGLDERRSSHVTKAFYALENFVENLGEGIQPYLPTLMEKMLSALSCSESLRIRELAVSAIGAIANAAKESLVPFFPPVIDSLKGFLTDTREEMRSLQTQALDTLGVLGRTVGKEVFSPLAPECVQLGLKLTDTVDDPDLRRCTYSLFSAVSTVCPECLTPHLSSITTLMLMSLKSTEGVTAHLDEEHRSFLLLDEEDEDDDEEKEVVVEDESGRDSEGEERDIAGFSVENAYIDEKEDACDALGEIAYNTGSAFLPFLESSFQQVYELHDFPHENVRKAAYEALGQFCRAQHRVWEESPTESNHQALHKLLSVVTTCFLKAVREEKERQVVMAVLESLNAVLKSCKGEALQENGRLQEISHTIRDVLKKKTACQDAGDDGDDDEQQAEYDAMLQEFAGEGIPLLAAAVPGETFSPYLNELLPLLINKTKPSCTVADRSFSLGTLAEILQALGGVSGGAPVAVQLASRLLPVLVGGVRDSDAEVRSNSVFGVGALAQACGPALSQDYPAMLALFSSLLSRESDRRVIDNLCAALSRMILANTECVPLEQVLPAVLSCLPLKEDLEENSTVFSCLAFLYTHTQPLVVGHLKPVVSAVSQVLGTKELKPDIQNTLLLLLRDVAQRYPQEFQTAVMSLPAQGRATVTSAVTAS